MSNVAIFPEKNDPHLAGPAICTHCKHEWSAVAPVGTVHLKCPSCERFHGIFDAPVLPAVGDHVWTCNCGGELFSILERGTRCIKCGTYQKFN